jgi:hypothetical protein
VSFHITDDAGETAEIVMASTVGRGAVPVTGHEERPTASGRLRGTVADSDAIRGGTHQLAHPALGLQN